jgi:molecular chaperone GrpE (heat shock protein)
MANAQQTPETDPDQDHLAMLRLRVEALEEREQEGGAHAQLQADLDTLRKDFKAEKEKRREVQAELKQLTKDTRKKLAKLKGADEDTAKAMLGIIEKLGELSGETDG